MVNILENKEKYEIFKNESSGSSRVENKIYEFRKIMGLTKI